MAFWMIFWKAVFIITVSMFAFLAVWVTIKGYSDIKTLLLKVDESHRE
ncbi:MAG: hypothetical protein H6695_07590 [Deferribacteres bacterium]|nr:hypothetical protein [Deferribacteres bacterium]